MLSRKQQGREGAQCMWQRQGEPKNCSRPGVRRAPGGLVGQAGRPWKTVMPTIQIRFFTFKYSFRMQKLENESSGCDK